MIEVINLTKSLPNGKKLLDGISFKVGKGEFVGILGPSGAGKTLTIRCLNGLLKPDHGSVILRNGDNIAHDICRMSRKELRKVRQRIGMIFQGFHLVQRLSALENVMIGRLGQINSFRSLLYGFTDREADEALGALEKARISHLAESKVGNMSGGEMQRVAIARAIYQRPSLLLADEPISNLDPSNAKSIMKLIKPLSEEIPVVGVFHQPEMTAKYCTRVIAIKEGKIIYDGDPKLSSNQLIEIYGEELQEIEMKAGTVVETANEVAPVQAVASLSELGPSYLLSTLQKMDPAADLPNLRRGLFHKVDGKIKRAR
jgi:phosphonate transport system ATP-binding protein